MTAESTTAATPRPRPIRHDDPLIFILSTKAAQRRRDRRRFIERQLHANQGRYPWVTPRSATHDGAA